MLTSTRTQIADAQTQAQNEKQVGDYQTLGLPKQGKGLTTHQSFS